MRYSNECSVMNATISNDKFIGENINIKTISQRPILT